MSGDKKVLSIITIHPAPYIDEWLKVLQVDFEVYDFYYYNKSAAKLWKNGKRDFRLINSIRGFYSNFRIIIRSDCVILPGWSYYRTIIIMIILKLLRVNYVCFSDHPNSAPKAALKTFLKMVFLRYIVGKILCATHSTIAFYAEEFRLRAMDLYFFPYCYSSSFADLNRRFTRSSDIECNGKMKLFVANNFIARKGYEELFSLFEYLDSQRELEYYQVDIAGAGALFEEYSERRVVRDGLVRMHGWVSSDDYERFMFNSDMFVHCSRFEPFGIPPLDAVMAGCILIVSDEVHSVIGILEDNVDAFIFRAGSSSSLEDALSRALASRSRWEVIRKSARSKIGIAYDRITYSSAISKVIVGQR